MANPPLQSPTNPHFFQPLLPGFDTDLKIPVTFFSRHIEGKTETTTVQLISEASDKTWEVKIDGRRLTKGWKDFATSHDLRVGDIVIFKHEGDMVFSVSPFGPSCCEIQYTQQSHIIMEEDNIVDDNENQHKIRNVLRNDLGSCCLSFDYCFVAQVTDSNLQRDALYIPGKAARSNVVNRRFHEMIVVNEEGKPWTLNLKFKESDKSCYISGGWRSFCHENRKKIGDLIAFNLVGDGKSTPMICVCPEEKCINLIREYMSKEKKQKPRSLVASSSSEQNRFLTIVLTRYNIKNSKLILPTDFVKRNKINDYENIILEDGDGKMRLVKLVHEGPRKRGLGKGWKIFCEANGVFHIGVPFLLELKWKHRFPLLQFISKVKIEQICV